MISGNRCIALKEAGYDVIATSSVKAALELLGRDRLDAVIVGHRFPAEEKCVLVVEAKDEATRVLCQCASADSRIPATSRVYGLEGSEGLLSALSALDPR